MLALILAGYARVSAVRALVGTMLLSTYDASSWSGVQVQDVVDTYACGNGD